MPSKFPLGIGALSERTGAQIETLRYYEREGLMPDPPRTEGGHRLYDEGHLKRLTFIRRSRELGFSLDAVRGLLRLVDGGHYTCAEVRTVVIDHLEVIRRKQADLANLEEALETMADQCSGDELPECPIVEALFTR